MMIKLESVVKKYGTKTVIEDATCQYEEGRIYGLAGYNGSGKTTLLKTIAGVFRPDGGRISVNGIPVDVNVEFKSKSFLMTEELFFYPQSTLEKMKKIYKGYYPSWDEGVYEKLLVIFGLSEKDKIAGFSKGMQRQAGLLLALSVLPQYLFLDETFDGLDVVKRHVLSNILNEYVNKRNALVIVTSHYLGELENLAGSIGLIENNRLIIPEIAEGSLENYFTSKMEIDENAIKNIF